jgi:hypothetical protein
MEPLTIALLLLEALAWVSIEVYGAVITSPIYDDDEEH